MSTSLSCLGSCRNSSSAETLSACSIQATRGGVCEHLPRMGAPALPPACHATDLGARAARHVQHVQGLVHDINGPLAHQGPARLQLLILLNRRRGHMSAAHNAAGLTEPGEMRVQPAARPARTPCLHWPRRGPRTPARPSCGWCPADRQRMPRSGGGTGTGSAVLHRRRVRPGAHLQPPDTRREHTLPLRRYITRCRDSSSSSRPLILESLKLTARCVAGRVWWVKEGPRPGGRWAQPLLPRTAQCTLLTGDGCAHRSGRPSACYPGPAVAAHRTRSHQASLE